MSNTAMVTQTIAEIVERLVTTGDLSQLTPQQRTSYYLGLCNSLSLKAELQPFEYIKLNGKLILYAKKACAEQLRQLHAISIYQIEERETEETLIVTAHARNGLGREDVDQGVVTIKGLHGDAMANARMKAITKAKRRVTLSLCGIGMLDQTELETISGAQKIGFDNWHCTEETAYALIDKCRQLERRGVTLDQLRALLPAGLQSRQQLSEAQSQLFLNDLEKLGGQNVA